MTWRQAKSCEERFNNGKHATRAYKNTKMEPAMQGLGWHLPGSWQQPMEVVGAGMQYAQPQPEAGFSFLGQERGPQGAMQGGRLVAVHCDELGAVWYAGQPAAQR